MKSMSILISRLERLLGEPRRLKSWNVRWEDGGWTVDLQASSADVRLHEVARAVDGFSVKRLKLPTSTTFVEDEVHDLRALYGDGDGNMRVVLAQQPAFDFAVPSGTVGERVVWTFDASTLVRRTLTEGQNNPPGGAVVFPRVLPGLLDELDGASDPLSCYLRIQRTVALPERQVRELAEKYESLTGQPAPSLEDRLSVISGPSVPLQTSAVPTKRSGHRVIEHISAVCDGRRIYPSWLASSAHRRYMCTEAVVDTATASTKWTTVKGSSLLYKPPRGTQTVVYGFSFMVGYHQDSRELFTAFVRVAVDGVPVLSRQQMHGSSLYYGEEIRVEIPLTNKPYGDPKQGNVDFSSPRVISTQIRCSEHDYRFTLFGGDDLEVWGDAFESPVAPVLTVEAIGRC